MGNPYIRKLKPKNNASVQEIKQFIKQWQETQDYEARNKVVLAYTPLVIKYAFHYRRDNNEDDLISEGILAIIHALDSFDLSFNVNPATYFKYSVVKAIKHYVVFANNQVYLGSGKLNRFVVDNLEKVKHRLQIYNSNLTAYDIERIAQFMGIEAKIIINVYNTLYGSISVDADGHEDDFNSNRILLKNTLTANELNPEEHLINKLPSKFKPHLKSAINELQGIEADVFINRNIVEPPVNLDVLGVKYNMSRYRIQRLNNQIVKQVTDKVLTLSEMV